MLQTKEDIYIGLGRKGHVMDFFHESQKCGSVRIDEDSPERIYLWNLEIFVKFRGKGLSHILMQDIISYVKETLPLADVIQLRVVFENDKAQHVYKKAGFVFLDNVSQYTYIMEYKL